MVKSQRIRTARRVFRREGVAGVLSAVKDRYCDNWAGRQLDWWYGKMVELRGNVVRIDGCTFDIDCPAITTASKGKFMLGRYERPERTAVKQFLDPELPVIELGGAIGVIACLTNRRLARPQHHVVVEANPALIPLLTANRERNRCAFTVLHRLVAYGGGRGIFYAHEGNFVIGSALSVPDGSSVGGIEVVTTSLREIVRNHRFERFTLVCDIEGGESDLIRYEGELLAERVQTIIIELHEWILGRARARELLGELDGLGFRPVASEAETYIFQKR